jgi:hypothetical protein
MASSTRQAETPADRVVQLWFGTHRLAECKAEPVLAQRCAEAWQRRFPSLRVTNDPVSLTPGQARS